MPKRLSRRRLKKYWRLAGIILTLGLAIAQQHGYLKPALDAAQKAQPGLYRVISFADGDTITIDMNGNPEKIRFIGVDTPETHDPRKTVQCFGQNAASFTKSLIGNNRVRLESDGLSTNRDRYNRLLRYVYLPDGTFVNSELLKQGYAFAYTNFPFTRADEFRNLEKEARTSGRGLWGSCVPIIESNGYVNSGQP